MNSIDALGQWALAPRALLAFLPVLLFLLALKLLDSFHLLRARRIWYALGAGCLGGLVSYVINSALLDLTGLSVMRFAVLIAPVVEELVKATYLIWAIRSQRISFLVEAVALGFAVGTGFSLVENAYYLSHLGKAPLLVWIIRGFGTAVMHAGVTGILAALAVGFRRPGRGGDFWLWVGAPLVAAALHAAFNRALVQPIVATVSVAVLLPLVLRLVYGLGERRLRRWLGRGFDRDTELLVLIREGKVRETPLGQYLLSLRRTFRPDMVADMLCLLRLQAELSIRAKGMLLLRENGLRPNPDPEIRARLEELSWLERAVGKTGLLALRPVRPWTSRDLWQRHLLEDSQPR